MSLPLSTLDEPALRELSARVGLPAWRGTQLRQAVWQPGAGSLDEVRQLPAPVRAALGSEVRFSTVEVLAEREADGGATVKLLLGLDGGLSVETVAMETPAGAGCRSRRATVCVSTQVGCAVGCPFCATGRAGLRRSCSAAEIVDQVRAASRALWRRGLGPVTHVVYMGMGEPLANYDATVASVRALASGAGISPRRMTVSTSGVVPAIRRLTGEGLSLTLAISLHAADDGLRDRLVPLNRAHPLTSLLPAGRAYAEATGRRLSLEWCLIGGVNDSEEQATRLRRIAHDCRAHVNVIPMNRIEGSPWGPPEAAVTRRFLAALRGVRTTVRDTRGASGEAACGQLRASLEPLRALRPDGTLGPPRSAASTAGR
jgi:23S rRNA (adenine2503-C2)-methyltransferase